jgi:hypothetical protein
MEMANPYSVYVQLQLQEFGAWIALDGSDKRWWHCWTFFSS